MKRLFKKTGIIACAAAACILTMNIMPSAVAAEEGGTVIITGGEEAAPAATPVTDAYVSGNKVIIVAPTSEAVSTAAPQTVTGGDDKGTDQGTASIDISKIDSSEVVVEKEDVDVDYIIASNDSNKKEVKASAKPTAKANSASKKVNKPVSKANEKAGEDDIPKTGVVRMEFVFAGIGIILLLAGTCMSVKYLKRDRI